MKTTLYIRNAFSNVGYYDSRIKNLATKNAIDVAINECKYNKQAYWLTVEEDGVEVYVCHVSRNGVVSVYKDNIASATVCPSCGANGYADEKEGFHRGEPCGCCKKMREAVKKENEAADRNGNVTEFLNAVG